MCGKWEEGKQLKEEEHDEETCMPGKMVKQCKETTQDFGKRKQIRCDEKGNGRELGKIQKHSNDLQKDCWCGHKRVSPKGVAGLPWRDVPKTWTIS